MDPFIGQITLFPYNFAPSGWALCQGQLLPISQNTALFSLLGTQFGGDGKTNFGLPDMRGRVPIGQGQGPGLTPTTMGEMLGVENVTLLANQSGAHSHAFPAYAVPATANAPAGAAVAEGHATGRGGGAVNTYAAPGTPLGLAAAQLGPPVGGNQPHNNLQPYLTMNWCIALQGIFPSRP